MVDLQCVSFNCTAMRFSFQYICTFYIYILFQVFGNKCFLKALLVYQASVEQLYIHDLT